MDKYNLTESEKDCLRCMVFASYFVEAGSPILFKDIARASMVLNKVECLHSLDTLCECDFIKRIGFDYVLDKNIINSHLDELLVREETKRMMEEVE